MKKVFVRVLFGIFAAGAIFLADPASANAAGSKPDPKFDHKYYADTYPDLKSAFGYDRDALWNHYVVFGKKEGRKCYPGDPNGKTVLGASRFMNPSDFAKAMLEQVNAYRASKGIAPLQLSKKCLDVANVRATECATKFSHTRPNRTSFGSAYTDLGYTEGYVCENCAKIGIAEGVAADSVPVAMEVFRSSSKHDAAMLDPNYNFAGFGFYTANDGNVYMVQEFSND
jgi:uncharacterized protein YkwD